MQPPVPGDHPVAPSDNWLAISGEELPIGDAYSWVLRPDCGAVVLFSGTVRDHADGRDGVQFLDYEAYESAALDRFASIADEIRTRWPVVGRIVLLHRIGRLELGDSAVVAAVSAPHRPAAFEAARFAIDALKATAPIWKHETWNDGADWGSDAAAISDLGSVAR